MPSSEVSGSPISSGIVVVVVVTYISTSSVVRISGIVVVVVITGIVVVGVSPFTQLVFFVNLPTVTWFV